MDVTLLLTKTNIATIMTMICATRAPATINGDDDDENDNAAADED
jgi:hypothetical protein